MNPWKWLASFIPSDPNPEGGFYFARLPESAQWMNDVFEYHDEYYRIGPGIGMRLSDIDWRIFRALVARAESEPDLMKRCQMVHDICRYWPIMRRAGHVLYGRHRTQAEKELKPL